jgi:hypothetical protein
MLRHAPVVAARVGRALLSLLAVLAVLVAGPSRALAADAAQKTIAVYVEGADTDAVRVLVLGVVPDRIRVLDPSVFADALAREGQRGPFGNALTQAKSRDKALAKIRKAAAAAGADAVIAGRSKKTAAGASVWLLFVDAIPGDLAVDQDVPLSGPSDERKAALRKALATALDDLSPPPKEAPKAAEPPPPEPPPPPPKPARKPHVPGTALVIAGLGFDVGGRRFAFTDPITPNARDYDVFGAPMPNIALELYPAAGTSIPVLEDLGLTGSFAHAFAVQSAAKDGTKFGTSWTRASGALRFRFRPGQAQGPMIGVSGGFSFTGFDFKPPASLASSVPSVAYASLRAGLDARIPFWRMALLLDAGYDGALSAGAVHDRYRGAKVGGVDFGGGLSLALAAGFELRLTAHYTRYFYAFDPVPGDAYVAGGALDEFLGFGLGAAYAY